MKRETHPEGTALVTIGIPTRNRAKSYLRGSLESALAQTWKDLEIVVSDNCSGDGTAELIRESDDSRIRYFRQDVLLEAHDNADFCLQQARGKYFLLLHDDDLIDSDFVERCVAKMTTADVGFVQTGIRRIDGEGRVLAVRPSRVPDADSFAYFEAILKGRANTYFCNTLYDTDRLRLVGGFRSSGHVYQDVITNIKLFYLYGRAEIEEPKASYRIHQAKMGGASDIRRWCEDALEMIEVMARLLPERRRYFEREGRRVLCLKTCAKRVNSARLRERLLAYGVVFWKFRYRPVFDVLIHLRKQNPVVLDPQYPGKEPA